MDTLLVTGNKNKAMDNYVRFGTKPAEGTLTVDGNTIIVTGLKLAKNASFTIVIEDLEVATDAGAAASYRWETELNIAEGTTTAVVADVAAESPTIYVVQRSNNAASPAVTFGIVGGENDITDIASPRYNASSKQHIRFKFTLAGTPIKGGAVWFDIPSTWARPSPTDVVDKATVKLVLADGTFADKIDDDTTLSVSGTRVRVNIAEAWPKNTVFTIQYGKDGDDDKYQGQVQPDGGDIEIIGRFNSGLDSRGHPASRIVVTIDNVADGSGTATISTNNSSDRRAVKAGSKGNTVTVTYTAEGRYGWR